MKVTRQQAEMLVTSEWKSALELQANETPLIGGATRGYIDTRIVSVQLASGKRMLVRQFKRKEDQQ